jgi:hypothetical protein
MILTGRALFHRAVQANDPTLPSRPTMCNPGKTRAICRAWLWRTGGSVPALWVALVLVIVAGLLAQSFNPPRTLTRPFSSPTQRPLEEEPHEESSGHGKLGQTAGSSPGGSRRSESGRAFASIPPVAGQEGASALNWTTSGPLHAEIAGRNGIGAPLRC